MHFISFFSHDRWRGLENRSNTEARIRDAVNDVAASMGGTFSVEHGVGRTMLAAMSLYKADIELRLMRTIKRALDPALLLNPGPLLPSGACFSE